MLRYNSGPLRPASDPDPGPPGAGRQRPSEVRLWVLGATAHMHNNNRWAREGGVIDEILVENMYRNKEGNPIIFDTILLEKVVNEPNITLLLNTALIELTKSNPDTIEVGAGVLQPELDYVRSYRAFILRCDRGWSGRVF